MCGNKFKLKKPILLLLKFTNFKIKHVCKEYSKRFQGAPVVPQERYLPPWRGDLEPSGGQSAWVDPSEPIYTDPSLFER